MLTSSNYDKKYLGNPCRQLLRHVKRKQTTLWLIGPSYQFIALEDYRSALHSPLVKGQNPNNLDVIKKPIFYQDDINNRLSYIYVRRRYRKALYVRTGCPTSNFSTYFGYNNLGCKVFFQLGQRTVKNGSGTPCKG